jgi:hypothetical protein
MIFDVEPFEKSHAIQAVKKYSLFGSHEYGLVIHSHLNNFGREANLCCA